MKRFGAACPLALVLAWRGSVGQGERPHRGDRDPDALEFLARAVSHIPNQGQPAVHCRVRPHCDSARHVVWGRHGWRGWTVRSTLAFARPAGWRARNLWPRRLARP